MIYGKDEEERLPEIRAIAEWLARWARDVNGWDHNLIALGDFNIDRKGDPLHDAFVSTELDIPEDLQGAPRTIFGDPQKPELNKFYDQIAWFTGRNGLPALTLRYSRGELLRFHGCGVGVAGVDQDGAYLADLRPLPAVDRILRARVATNPCFRQPQPLLPPAGGWLPRIPTAFRWVQASSGNA